MSKIICGKTFDISYMYLWSIREIGFIFGMHIEIIKTFQMIPMSMTLWPWSLMLKTRTLTKSERAPPGLVTMAVTFVADDPDPKMSSRYLIYLYICVYRILNMYVEKYENLLKIMRRKLKYWRGRRNLRIFECLRISPGFTCYFTKKYKIKCFTAVMACPKPINWYLFAQNGHRQRLG